jgi:hypothetical protein
MATKSPPQEMPEPADSRESGEDAVPVEQDRSGWPPHPSERRDFYHRIRAFPPEVTA